MVDKKHITYEGRARIKNSIGRMIFVGICIIIQIVLILDVFDKANAYAGWLEFATQLIAVILVLVIYNQRKTSSMKMPWIILIMLAPVAGTILYFMIAMSSSTKRMRERYSRIDAKLYPLLPDNGNVLDALGRRDERARGIASYVKNHAFYPVYNHTEAEYYSDTAAALQAQLSELKKAERFIFMEYHAIEYKETWLKIQKVLEDRVKAGVEVRVFYDDMGSIPFINRDFIKHLESVGIKCRVFNPFMPFLNMFLNNRDHRKITVIDGKVAFTGGYNLADEYFNITHPYGEWKDSGIKLMGDAVQSFTVMFLEMWNAVKDRGGSDEEPEKYLEPAVLALNAKGFVQPYADSPMDMEHVGEDVYISILDKAEKYCYFVTPYLILTDEMTHAMCLASKRGVDVRIITPGIPDKKIVYRVTRSYYHNLVIDGVRIYEWTPGFCHSKLCVSDDRTAACGTINLDYRSLYHHFEDGVLIYGDKAVLDIRDDIRNTFSQCREVTEDYMDRRAGSRLDQLILKLFAELL